MTEIKFLKDYVSTKGEVLVKEGDVVPFPEKVMGLVLKKGFNPKTTRESMIKNGYSEDLIRQCKFCSSWNCIAYSDLIQCFDCKERWKNERES